MRRRQLIRTLLSAGLCVTLAASGLGIAACAKDDAAEAIGIGYYDSLTHGVDGETAYNDNLFRKNSFETVVADPFVLRVNDPSSEDYGCFYMYGTIGNSVSLECYKSETLEEWEYAGTAYIPDRNTDVGKAAADCFWAPEVVYGGDGFYYMFFTASRLGNDGSRVKIHVPYVARSATPAGPYEIVCNAHNENRGNTAYSSYNTDRFCLFNNDEVAKWGDTLGATMSAANDMRLPFIDLHPFEAENGDKYLFFKFEQNGGICGVKMKSWIEPDYSTFTLLTQAGRLTVGGKNNVLESANTINEGPFVNEHNGKYYLTFSIYGYSDTRYSVCQAVADSPLGPYRKLTGAEGGVLLSADGGSMEGIYATGHHSFVEVSGKTYIIYHAFDNMACKGDRYACVDEVKWVTITDSTGGQLDVMYCNGPTVSVMPRLDFNTEYTNIAPLAEVSATGLCEGGGEKRLTDGLLNVNTITNTEFMEEYVNESTFDTNARITLKFDSWRTVRSVMIYNSNDRERAFESVKNIVMTCALRDGTVFKAKIENLGFDWDNYSTYDGIGIRGGAAAIAEFDEMLVSEIVINIDKPEANEYVAVSEIIILGKEQATAKADSIEQYKDEYTFTPAERGKTQVNDGITIDGKLDEKIWESCNWYSLTYTSPIFVRDYTLEVTTCFGENGVYFAFRSDDCSLFYSPSVDVNYTSGVEFYLSAPDKNERHLNALEIGLSAYGKHTEKLYQFSGYSTYVRGKTPLFAASVNGEMNAVNGADGYTMEYYIPFENIGLSDAPEYVNSVPCLIVTNSANQRERWAFCAMGYGFTDGDGEYHSYYQGYNATKPSTWMKWGKNGFIG